MQTCTHCDEIAVQALYSEIDLEKTQPFCCQGCLTVFHVLHQKGLDSYYEIKKNAAVYKRRSPVELTSSQFNYLEDVDFLAEYSYVNLNQEWTMEFYLEGIHCLACLWLIEKIPEFVEGVKTSKLDLERSVVTVTLKNNGKFSRVAQELTHLGYRPHPLKKNQDAANFRIKEERSALIRIGVAGAAAGNIMIYAVSLYGGATPEFAQLFNLLTVLFAIPVLTYSAFPFYQTAWNAIKNRTLSIDIPISIALIIGAFMGIHNLIVGVPENYFDSLTALVFLLLLSRYFLQKIQEKGLSASDLHFFYQSESVLVSVDDARDSFKEIHPRFIKVNDSLKIRPGEFIPADGIVLRGCSNLNNSLLTGESYPIKVEAGDHVFNGTQNIDHELIIKAEKVHHDTRLGGILKNIENGWAHRSKIVDLASKVSKYFTAAVFVLATILFFYLNAIGSTEHALEQAITLLIVTCPCALALAIPLTFTRALSKASEHGIIIKSDEVIEKLAKVENIFLDKTGTITFGKLQVTDLKELKGTAINLADIIFNLEKNSHHPVAKALMEHFKSQRPRAYEVLNHKEIFGKGVSGMIDGHYYEINKVGVFENDQLVATFSVQDIVRPDSISALASLRSQGLTVKVLSGDNAAVVEAMAKLIGMKSDHALFELSPEQKSQMIESTPHTMMVGDGANDAIALSYADVGVAVFGAMDISLRAADVYLTTPGLVPVEKLVTLSKETMKVIRRNLVLSLIYNSLSVTAAFLGLIDPLVAAIIMPVSSLTVLFSTLIGTKKLRHLWKS